MGQGFLFDRLSLSPPPFVPLFLTSMQTRIPSLQVSQFSLSLYILLSLLFILIRWDDT